MKDRDNMVCDCGARMIRPPSLNKAFVDIWKPITLEHIADEPMTFETKKSLQAHCRKTGLSSGALL